MKKKLLAITALSFALLVIVSSCSSKSLNDAKMESMSQNGYSDVYDEEMSFEYGGFADYKSEYITEDSTTYSEEPSGGNIIESPEFVGNRKIIYSSSYSIQTTGFDKSILMLEQLCTKYGAYYEYSEMYGTKENADRNGTFTIRVPVQNYNAFKSEAGGIGVVIRSSENNRDVTEEYIDTEARLQSAKVREERLLEILANADSLDDVLLLEQELADVRYEIETLSGSLRKYDSLISYSTIDINIREVIEPVEIKPVPKTFSQKVSAAISDGFDDFSRETGDFFLEILYNLPGIIIFVVTIIIICVIIKAVIKKAKKKTETIITNNESESTDIKENS